MRRRATTDEIEIAVGPHAARAAWSVLRVTFARQAAHERRVARALDALLAPDDPAPAKPDSQAGDTDGTDGEGG